jgi:hypothetical protein
LIQDEKRCEEKPSDHQQKYGDDDVCDGRNKVGAEFLLEYGHNLSHISTPEIGGL